MVFHRGFPALAPSAMCHSCVFISLRDRTFRTLALKFALHFALRFTDPSSGWLVLSAFQRRLFKGSMSCKLGKVGSSKFLKGPCTHWSIYLGPTTTTWKRLQGPSIYISTWTLWELLGKQELPQCALARRIRFAVHKCSVEDLGVSEIKGTYWGPDYLKAAASAADPPACLCARVPRQGASVYREDTQDCVLACYVLISRTPVIHAM